MDTFRSVVYSTCLIILICMCGCSSQFDSRIEFVLKEQVPPSTFIASVPTSAHLITLYKQEELRVFRYALLSSSEYSDYFTIDSKSGILRTSKLIDREVICPRAVECPINLDVGVQPREYFQVIKITIKITDINDHSPNFEMELYSRKISENSPIGISFPVPVADDLDSPHFGVHHYDLIVSSPKFSLKVVNGTGELDVFLVLDEKLDREKTQNYEIILAAYDGGIPSKVGTLTIHIVVQDINDNQPNFEKSIYQTRISEDATLGSVVLKVTATDIDYGLNGQVIYDFNTKTKRNFGHYFNINNSSGVITLKNHLRYEKYPSYNLIVTAKDMNPDSLQVTTNVLIDVDDVNDNAPEITISSPPDTNNVKISESSPMDTFVAFIIVRDADSGRNGDFSCSVSHPSFSVIGEGIDYTITTRTSLDREQIPHYEVFFVCKDNGSPSLTSSITLMIDVLDENDNAPVFDQRLYSITLKENNVIGQSLFYLSATDKDTGNNADIYYNLEGPHSDKMSIDSFTGEIKANAVFDFEELHEIRAIVVATDKGEPPLSATTNIQINIVNVDDNVPSFRRTSYSFHIKENQPVGSFIGQVVAHDLDSPQFSMFSYKFDRNIEDARYFQIDRNIGNIFSKVSFDRENKSQYFILVEAVSTQNKSSYNHTYVTINIEDVNDHSPRFVFPSHNNHTLQVFSNSRVGSEVGRIIAKDSDTGANAALKYFSHNKHNLTYFHLHSDTGIIYVKKNLDELLIENIILNIVVQDSGEHSLQSETFLNIYVNKSLAFSAISMNNLTIVISVVVISCALIFLLLFAIAITRQKQKRHNNLKEISRNNEQMKSFRSVSDKTPSSLCSWDLPIKQDNILKDVDRTSELSTQLPDVTKNRNHGCNVQDISKDGSFSLPSYLFHPEQRSSLASYSSSLHKKYDIPITLLSDISSPLYASKQNMYNNEIQTIFAQDKDSDSGNTDPGSNIDSGRGSNDDNIYLDFHNESFASPHKETVVLRPSTKLQTKQFCPSQNSLIIPQSLTEAPKLPNRPPPPRPLFAKNKINNGEKNRLNHLSKDTIPVENLHPKNRKYCPVSRNSCHESSSGPDSSDEEKEHVYYIEGSVV